MKKNLFVTCLASVFLLGCSKDTNAPSDSLPTNTLRLMVNGKTFPVDPNHTTLKIRKPSNGYIGRVTLFTSSASTSEEITLYAFQLDDNVSIEAPGEFGDSKSNMRIYADYLTNNGSAGYTFRNDYCDVNNKNFTIKIESVNTAAHTMIGSFNGNLCNGSQPMIKVENGRFNLPYTIEP
ncbi:hypothetical protein [Hymenobacter wooponensis]|uniref:Lipoprotein n=1 Tax=Hymenobacter wooponensis TaxID=1525360 RepID=A0A4Z0MS47_9BACT|nr:hypothetical protein [Hymenobacter wooponensis]TGD82633.1 hypothetical protein EU557_02280 [Hymenobacter wooponensis]